MFCHSLPRRRQWFYAAHMRPLVLCLLLVLAACGSSRPPPPAYRTSANAAFVAPDRIEISARDSEVLDAAELIAPDGQRLAAFQILTDTSRARPGTFGRPEFGLNVEGGSSSGINPGLTIGIPVNGLFGAPRPPATVDSKASIRLPRPEAYRANFAEWKIQLRFGRPDEGPRYVTLAAPPPDLGQ